MSRKPIDEQQPSECRQAIWNWIRKYDKQNGPCAAFKLKDINVNLNSTSIRDYLNGLTNAEYLVCTRSLTPKGPDLYSLVKDVGVDAPRVRKDGTPVTQGQSRQQMWNTLRIIKCFSAADLAFNSSTPDCQVAESEAKGYISFLLKANYLRALSAGKPGHKPGTGTQARYMLIPSMWTGPQPPQIQRTKQLYDPNLKRVVWAKIEGGAE